MGYRYTIRFLFVVLCLVLIKSASAVTVIDSVRTTESTCGNNGTITVFAHSTNPPMSYSIISGPSTKLPQSSNIFSSLDSGTYRILVVGFNKDSAQQSVFVPGTYRDLFLNPIVTSPTCRNSSTGIIIGNAVVGVGRKPYLWTLTYPNTTTLTQASDTFKNLPPGVYSIRINDSCQNFATRIVTITNPITAFSYSYFINKVMGCDSTLVTIALTLPSGIYLKPYTIKVTTPFGTYTKTASFSASGDLIEIVPKVTYGDYANFTIYNSCGDSIVILNQISPFQFPIIQLTKTSTACVTRVSGKLILNNSLPNNKQTAFNVPVTMVVKDSVSGLIVDSIVYKDTAVALYELNTKPLIPNKSYTITVKDKCGKTYIKTFFFFAKLPSLGKFVDGNHCLDSTVTYSITAYDFSTITFLKFLSGPKNIGSSKPYYQYKDTLVYNKTYFPNYSCYNCYAFPNLSVGKYVFQISDSCGNVFIDSFTILPSQVGVDRFSFVGVPGCPGQNKIRLSISGEQVAGATVTGIGFYTIESLPSGTQLVTNKSFYWTKANGYLYLDSLTGLNPGKYAIRIDYQNRWAGSNQVNQSIACKSVFDTINIPVYIAPKVLTTQFVKCNGNGYAIIVPDSTKGVAPYSFRMISPPPITTIQTANYFPINTPGIYRVEISDACGSGSIYDFTVDTSTYVAISKIGSSCLGGDVKLYSVSSSYVTYVWNKPGGGTFIGDTLKLNPISILDIGTYRVTKIIKINGCTDSIKLNYVLVSNIQTTNSKSICSGQSLVVGTKTYTLPGVYRDTFITATCDSISILTLTLNPYKRDSINKTICAGKSYAMGGNLYLSTGIYRDTFTTSGCDSIVTLNLTVTPYKLTTITTSICANKSITIGSHTYKLAGTYKDTISTITCDSIVTLNLSVNPLKQSSLVKSICLGDSFQVGAKYYTLPGLYQDTLSTSGCDSIVILNLSILPLKRDTISATIRQGQNYTVGIHNYTITGIYRDTFGTIGCDSIVLLNLTVLNAMRDTLNPILCEGDTFFMGGNPYTTTGVYIDTFAANPSDSIVVLNLTVNPLKRVTINQSICEGRSFMMGGNSYNANGTYIDTLSTTGCDSIVTLNLSITLLKRTTLTTSICANKSITIGTHTYTSAGSYSDTIATANCDSIVTLNLSVTPLGTGILDTTICAGRSITIGSKTHTAAGIYQDTVSTSNCDSIITVTLTLAPYKRDTQTVTICEGLSVLVGPKSYTQSGVYNDTLGTIGCDSIVRLYLTVTPLKRDTSNITICEGQSTVFGGNTYSVAGSYRDTFATQTCDSISLLILTVSPLKRVTSVQVICDGQSVQVGSKFYNTTGIYKDTFATVTCDSIYTLDLTVSPLKYTVLNQNICANGSYQVGNSIYTKAGTYNDTIPTTTCDSIVTLNLSILPLIYATIDTGICPGGSISIGKSTYTESGNYSDTISTTGCDSVVSLKLHIYNIPSLSITASSTDIIRGDTIQLSANGDMPLNYHWTGEAYYMTAFEEAPSAVLVSPSWLTVTAKSSDSCIVIDSIFIQVRPCGNVTLYMPNAFTPNGDDKNDFFKLFGNFITLNQLQIFNRWGEMVFETPDIENGWDGTYKGVQQPMGVYIYQLNYSACGELETKHLTGSITLIR